MCMIHHTILMTQCPITDISHNIQYVIQYMISGDVALWLMVQICTLAYGIL